MAFEHTTFPKKASHQNEKSSSSKKQSSPANVQKKKISGKPPATNMLFSICSPYLSIHFPHMFPIIFSPCLFICSPYFPHIFPISFPISLFFLFAQGRASERFFRASSKRLLGGTGKATRSTAAPIGPEIKGSPTNRQGRLWKDEGFLVEIFED